MIENAIQFVATILLALCFGILGMVLYVYIKERKWKHKAAS